MRIETKAAAAALAAMLVGGSANAALVVNGGFETGDFTGWTANPVSFPIYIVTNPVNSGAYAAQIAGFAYGPDTLSQTVGTTAGQSYTLSFAFWQDDYYPNGFDVSWNGVSVFAQTDTNTGNAYAPASVRVVGTGSDTLVFTAYNDPAFTYLDDVALTAVPEPESWALMITGFGAIGAAMRARRGALRVAA